MMIFLSAACLFALQAKRPVSGRPQPPAVKRQGVYIEGAVSFSNTGRGPGRSGSPREAQGGRPPRKASEMPKVVSRLWLQGDRRRLETTNPSGKRIVVVNRTGKFQLQPTMKTAFRLDISADMSHPGVRTLSLLDLNSKFDPETQLGGAEKLGTERVLGIECDIWRGNPTASRGTMTSNGRAPMRVWMPRNGKPAFPLKVEIVGIGPQSGTVSMEVTKVKYSDDMPDALFTVPKGYRIRQGAPPSGKRKPAPRGR